VALATIAGLAYLAGSYSAARQTRPESTIDAAQTTTAPVVTAPQPPTPSVPEPSSPSAASGPSAAPPRVSSPEVPTVSAAEPFSLDARIAATEQWLKQTPDSHHFIQLLVTDAASHEQVTAFIANNAGTLDLRQVRVYRSSIGGRKRLGVIYGDYPSRDQANAALATLGEISPSSRPYVRAVARLRSPGAAKGSS
jgi:septal ring-binding cell division protein DamX